MTLHSSRYIRPTMVKCGHRPILLNLLLVPAAGRILIEGIAAQSSKSTILPKLIKYYMYCTELKSTGIFFVTLL